MANVDYMAVADRAMAQIRKGAFLTVQSGGQLNTMTIGWATIGYCWRKPVFMVAVRDSRHTYQLLEAAADFTVSVPSRHMKEEIMFCGTRSGKDIDKFKALQLGTVKGARVTSPVIDITGIHLECAIVCKTPMSPALVSPELEPLYPEKDYHTLYFGEILACYETS